MNTPQSQIQIKGQIADASGHTDFVGTLDEAMDLIMQQVTKAGKWVYLNGSPYMFQNYDHSEIQEVRDKLANAEEPTFMLTARLQGGAVATKASNTVIRTRTTKSPISKVLNANRRAHIAVGISKKGKKNIIDVTVSNFNGAQKKLAKYREDILQAVFKTIG
jgi:hypothetical protein